MTGTFWRVWRWPTALALLTVVGLVSALVGDALWASALSWLGLGSPLGVALWNWSAHRRAGR
ncbi:MAG: hypothetical protein QM740_21030 [Acidovorax sp.]